MDQGILIAEQGITAPDQGTSLVRTGEGRWWFVLSASVENCTVGSTFVRYADWSRKRSGVPPGLAGAAKSILSNMSTTSPELETA